MISFVTLFLGLTFGFHNVEVHVDNSVAAVELLLDGALVSRIDGPPWVARFTFGEELSPHHLVAIAFTADGQEQDRVAQWVNLPRDLAEASVLLDQENHGLYQRVRVNWESRADIEPSEIRVTFDGQPLVFNDPRAIPLPPYDPEQLHFIRADLDFAGVVSSKAELIFGGTFTDQVNTELTALPITLEGVDDFPPLDDMQDWFTVDGESLRVVAVEKGSAEVVVVRDFGAWRDLARIRRTAVSNRKRQLWWFSSRHPAWNKWAFEFFSPVASRQEGAASMYELFPPIAKRQAQDGSLHGWVSTVSQPKGGGENQRLANCVTVAGVTAASGNRRRAVLLVLGNSPRDVSDLSPQMARRYLARLHVPLFVWTTSSGDMEDKSSWEDLVDVSTDIKMERASKEIFRILEKQRIVWLEGIYLPQEIVLTPEVSGVALVHPVQASG